jgi:hypothetical protein
MVKLGLRQQAAFAQARQEFFTSNLLSRHLLTQVNDSIGKQLYSNDARRSQTDSKRFARAANQEYD